MKKYASKVMGLVTVMVMAVAVLSDWQPSLFIFHQPQAPEGLKGYSLKNLKDRI